MVVVGIVLHFVGVKVVISSDFVHSGYFLALAIHPGFELLQLSTASPEGRVYLFSHHQLLFPCSGVLAHERSDLLPAKEDNSHYQRHSPIYIF